MAQFEYGIIDGLATAQLMADSPYDMQRGYIATSILGMPDIYPPLTYRQAALTADFDRPAITP